MNTHSVEFQFLDLFNPLYLKGFSSGNELNHHYENMRYAGICMFFFVIYEFMHFLPDNRTLSYQICYLCFLTLPVAAIIAFWINYYGDKLILSLVPNRIAPPHILQVWKKNQGFILSHLSEISSFSDKEKEILKNYQDYSDETISRIIYRNWHQTLRQIVDKRIQSR
jgi:hypothetical protein